MAGPTFAPAIEEQHRRIDRDAWDEIYVVGDVHGCPATFERLLADIDLSADDLVVLVGDLVRKGPDSGAVLDLVRSRENVISVRGNNEQKLLDGRPLPAGMADSDLEYLREMPLVISWDGALVVHGGIDHRKPLAAHDRTDLLTLRSFGEGGYIRPYWFERRREGPQVHFGHTVLAEPFCTDWAVGLDTGAVYGGQLTAYAWRAGRLHAVEAVTAHESRPETKIVDPQTDPSRPST